MVIDIKENKHSKLIEITLSQDGLDCVRIFLKPDNVRLLQNELSIYLKSQENTYCLELLVEVQKIADKNNMDTNWKILLIKTLLHKENISLRNAKERIEEMFSFKDGEPSIKHV